MLHVQGSNSITLFSYILVHAFHKVTKEIHEEHVVVGHHIFWYDLNKWTEFFIDIYYIQYFFYTYFSYFIVWTNQVTAAYTNWNRPKLYLFIIPPTGVVKIAKNLKLPAHQGSKGPRTSRGPCACSYNSLQHRSGPSITARYPSTRRLCSRVPIVLARLSHFRNNAGIAPFYDCSRGVVELIVICEDSGVTRPGICCP